MSSPSTSRLFPAARVVAMAALAVPVLVGCGSDEAGTDDSSAPTDAAELSSELAGVIDDAQRMAPALEGILRGTTYPTSLAEARQILADAGLEPSDGNVVAGYEYDPDTVEFVLCIEAPAGAFASYDTRPMSLFTTGEAGGCPTQ